MEEAEEVENSGRRERALASRLPGTRWSSSACGRSWRTSWSSAHRTPHTSALSVLSLVALVAVVSAAAVVVVVVVVERSWLLAAVFAEWCTSTR